MLQGSIIGPLLFLTYVNDIWRNIGSNIQLLVDDCVMCRNIIDSSDVDKLRTDLNRLGEWVVENEMKISPFQGIHWGMGLKNDSG